MSKYSDIPSVRNEKTFEQAIRDHADGREVCNCGQAYYNKDRHCESGCSTNQIRAKEELVWKLVTKLDLLQKISRMGPNS